MKKYTQVLTIAGSDSSGGAGIQADLKTFAALNCYGLTALTAVTAQNTQGVQAVFPLPAAIVASQIDSIFSDRGCDALKIGMLYNSDIIETVYAKLPKVPVVLDPVMYTSGGVSLLKPEAICSLKKLFPKSLLITPNLIEASTLLGYHVEHKEHMEPAAKDLLKMGARNVLLKGGHLSEGQGSDCFCSETGEICWFAKEPIPTKNTHGTGCVLSAAIAAFLAKKYSLQDSIGLAKDFFHTALCLGASYEWGPACAF